MPVVLFASERRATGHGRDPLGPHRAGLRWRRRDLYFADRSNHRIREVTLQGTISTVAGNGVLGYLGDGGPTTSAVHKRFRRLLDIAGLRRIRPHDLRHSAAALLVAQGVHGKAIQNSSDTARWPSLYRRTDTCLTKPNRDGRQDGQRSGSRGFHDGFHSDTEAGVVNSRLLKRLAPQVGLEPTTLRLTAGCSTN